MTRREGAPDASWSDVELLDWVDNALRNGNQMTKANGCFHFLLGRFGYEHTDLPGYVADMAKLEEEDAEAVRAREDAEFAKTVNPFPNHHGGLRP